MHNKPSILLLLLSSLLLAASSVAAVEHKMDHGLPSHVDELCVTCLAADGPLAAIAIPALAPQQPAQSAVCLASSSVALLTHHRRPWVRGPPRFIS